MLLQVVLIALGVFVGLAGEEWREDRGNFTATEEEKANVSVRLAGIRPPRFETTAWDLAVATGTLAHLDSELAFALARVYGTQDMTTQLGNGMMDAMYLRTPTLDGDAFLAALRLYYDDLTDIEPRLVPAYDTLLVAIDQALAE